MESDELNILDDFNICKKCHQSTDSIDEPAISCLGKCKQKVHISCLVVQRLFGDVFYEFYCSDCAEFKQQIVVRQKIPWLTVLILALYNLRIKKYGESKKGYFHYKSQIVQFIDKKWDILFDKSFKRTTEWKGTVSGYLSKYKEKIFYSAKSEFGKQGEGWWKLIGNDPPTVILENFKKEHKTAKTDIKKPRKSQVEELLQSRLRSEIDSCEDDAPSRQEKRHFKEFEPHKKKIKVEQNTDEDFGFVRPNINTDFPSFNFSSNYMDDLSIKSEMSFPDVFMSDSCENQTDDSSKDGNIDIFTSQKSFIKEEKILTDSEEVSSEESEIEADSEKITQSEDEFSEDQICCKLPTQSLFTPSKPKPLPWDDSVKIKKDDLRPLMSIQEEEYYLDKFERNKHLLDTAPIEVYRFYRRLVVRKQRRLLGLPILNIDNLGKNNTVWDQFILRGHGNPINTNIRLAGPGRITRVYSPHTKRLLKPYIMIDELDYSKSPLWFRIMTDLQRKVNGKNLEIQPEPKAVIDYCYIKPQHIPAVNRLCSDFFFPVDVTDCLNYPDFTVVALYKKLVIGCGIMVPDAKCSEAYISFLVVRPEWQNAGIGQAMLYHLDHSCMSTDITLHVSTSNPAAILYTKWGFKKEELVLNYYDKYFPPSSRESRDAIFYRLSRSDFKL